MTLLVGCATAYTVVETICPRIGLYTAEILDVLATVKQPASKQWVIDLNKLYEFWSSKACGTYINLSK